MEGSVPPHNPTGLESPRTNLTLRTRSHRDFIEVTTKLIRLSFTAIESVFPKYEYMGGLRRVFGRRRRKPEQIGPNPAVQQLEAIIKEQEAAAARQKVEEERWRAEEQLRRAEEQRARAVEEARRAEEERMRIEEVRRQAEEQVKQATEARVRAEQEKQNADAAMKRADTQRRAAEDEKRRAQEDAQKVHREMIQADQARQRAEGDAKRAVEDKRKAEEERSRAEEQRVRADEAKRLAEQQQRQAEDDKRRSEEERRKADEEAKKAKVEQEKAEEAKRTADRAAAEAQAALQEAEKALKEGIKPVLIPTREEFEATKRRLQYKEGVFHFAIAGISGSGKSSLINALRGLRNNSKDPLVAGTGVVETTSVITRFADTDPNNPIAWYDVPGAGTLEIPDWVYFNAQGLYIFDCIIVLTDNRFTQTDEAILRNCVRFKIPAFIVRSKSKQHIQNVLQDMSEDDEDDSDLQWEKARTKFITDTRKSVAQNLNRAELPQQRVYMIDKETLVKVVKGEEPKNCLDELDLLRDLESEAHTRRVKPIGS